MRKILITTTLFVFALLSLFPMWERISENDASGNAMGGATTAYGTGLSVLNYNPAMLLSETRYVVGIDAFQNFAFSEIAFSGGGAWQFKKPGIALGLIGGANINDYMKEWKADLSFMKTLGANKYVSIAVKARLMGYNAEFVYLDDTYTMGSGFIFNADAYVFVMPNDAVRFGASFENLIPMDASAEDDTQSTNRDYILSQYTTLSGRAVYYTPVRVSFGMAVKLPKTATVLSFDAKSDLFGPPETMPANEFNFGIESPPLFREIVIFRGGFKAVDLGQTFEASAGLGVNVPIGRGHMLIDYAFCYNFNLAAQYGRHFVSLSFAVEELFKKADSGEAGGGGEEEAVENLDDLEW